MKSNDLREKFLSYYENLQHKRFASSSLVPIDDPTLLFANAGMNQFKDNFTGKNKPQNKRAITSQKCVRAGGKHNDLDNVGKTARHHTFFEMLGNFSFGDYFKSEAIDFAWKFLTEELKIDKNKLYVTVHYTDDEAKEIWMTEQNIPEDRIFKLGDEDNFWSMGDTGPCGPCSEIFYDHGEKYSSGDYETLLEDEQRYVEIWNLVFMQYEQKADGSRVNLPAPSVDTGAGLERLAAVMQGVYWNYDTDAFSNLLKKIESITGKSYQDHKVAMQVIADHARSTTMLITDGVMPSNDGRGYVLRRIIRRAVRYANELGFKGNILNQLASCVLEDLGVVYKENAANLPLAQKILKQEEEKFRDTLDQGLKILEQFIKENPKQLSGKHAFKLYDTFGFPLDLTKTILEERSIGIDEDGFEKLMQEQVQRSKQNQKFKIQEDDLKKFYSLKESLGETKFIGYNESESLSKLLHIENFNDQTIAIFDQTPFYGESGGQIGDAGTIDIKTQVFDVQKPVDDLFVHIISSDHKLEVGKTYKLEVDMKRRDEIIKNHSATHMLQAALTQVLGDHVNQAGSLVTQEKLRFDFTHDKGLSEEEIRAVEEKVNSHIQEALMVAAKNMSKDQAIDSGAKALFGEKYGDEVRVVSMQGFSTELCGGIHVKNTADIQLFKIISESSLSIGVRRIEALTSYRAIKFLTERSETLKELEKSLNTAYDQIPKRINSFQTEIKKLQKENQNLQDKILAKSAENLFSEPQKLSNVDLYITKANTGAKELRKLSDSFIDKFPKDILFLYCVEADKASFILRTKKGNDFNFSKMTKNLMSNHDGRGGGKPDMTQGSFPIKRLDSLLEELKQELS